MTLVVYADTLIAVTFLYSLSGLILFGLIYNYRIRLPNIIVGSMTGALLSTYVLVLFLKSHVPVYLYLPFLILLFSVSLGIAYRFENGKAFCKAILSLFVINLAQAGAAVILLSLVAYRCRNWILLYIVLVVFAEAAVIVVLFRQSRVIAMHRKSVLVQISGMNTEPLRGLIDTGNILCDPEHHRPVILVSSEYREKVSELLADPFEMVCFTVNGQSLIDGGVIRELTVKCRKKERVFYNVPIAFSSVGFTEDGFGAIIPYEYAGGL